MSEKPQQDVSRETSCDDSVSTPEQDMLNEIMDRAMSKSSFPPKEERYDVQNPAEPGDGSHETLEPENSPPTDKNKRSSVYIYLVVLFGAAFLMLLLAYFVQQRNNATVLDDLRITSASREELLEDIKVLEEERDQLQKEVEYQRDRVNQIKEERDNLKMSLDTANSYTNDARIHAKTLAYFWYITQFMEHKEYPMAAAAIVFSADSWSGTWNSQISVNPAQVDQYQKCKQELIDKGYLQQLDHAQDGGTKIWFTDRWNPSQRDDMAALCILWCALDCHFVDKNDHAASQYLYLYPLSDPLTGYQDHISRLASNFSLEQFQIMKDALVKNEWLAVADDGAMTAGPGPHTDLLYSLPFDLPDG